MAITLPDEYSFVLIVAAITGLQLLLIGFSIPRRQFFSKAFFEQKFPKLGNVAVVSRLATTSADYERFRAGYPDMGNGRFAAQLEFEDWVTFNNAQRAHYNYLESIATVLVAELGCGVFFPRIAVLAGIVYIIGRALYTGGYKLNGPRGRRLGFYISSSAYLVMFFSLLYGGWKAGGGASGFISLVTGAQ